ncbi:hypothetical protein GIB67_008669 [Kingdonia uniflora]|uniref:Squalene epoxidase domain-containing protein n=1 Tax=Kingdonia uniflora TaxID=39325 RepID=A0A7J7M5A5_9MAGN|nr:hypothetical protein GIB67_008669 [Kingdonia uniflora]
MVPPQLYDSFIATIDKGSIKSMQNGSMPADPHPTPGALLMGDAFNMRHPLTGRGMMVALSDIAVGAQTETELKKKKLRVEDVLNATKAAVDEGIVVGGGCTLLKLAANVDAIKLTLDNGEQKVEADIIKRALSYPLKLIVKNVGDNGSVVMEKVLSSDNFKYCYNAATGKYENLMVVGIIDPTKLRLWNRMTTALMPLMVYCVVQNLMMSLEEEEYDGTGDEEGSKFDYSEGHVSQLCFLSGKKWKNDFEEVVNASIEPPPPP